jgi:hypothetical protein
VSENQEDRLDEGTRQSRFTHAAMLAFKVLAAAQRT